MKVMTVVGTRPELIRLSRIIPLLDKYTDHTFVYTNQNYDPKLKNIFFEELGIRQPDYTGVLDNLESIIETAIDSVQPERMLVLGDTYSGLAAAVQADTHDIVLYHMEAGNRCCNPEVPEETNRIRIDELSTVLLPYTETGRTNLLLENFYPNRIYVTGNPIYEVIKHYTKPGDLPELVRHNVVPARGYYLVTLHRAETIDNRARLLMVVNSLKKLSMETLTPIVISVHPHLEQKSKLLDVSLDSFIVSKPFGFKDFIQMERYALCVLTDSGTVQEECSILNVPCVILRTETERPETIESGTGVIAGRLPKDVIRSAHIAMDLQRSVIPAGYDRPNVSEIVLKIITGSIPP